MRVLVVEEEMEDEGLGCILYYVEGVSGHA
jgi:hypothetical protein